MEDLVIPSYGEKKMTGEITCHCRSCEGGALQVVLDLGMTPLADRLLTKAQLTEIEPRFPLQVAFCPDCGLLQLLETVPPEVLFCDNYPYFSSFSDELLEHSRRNVEELIAERSLGPGNFVIELASNDGYLLRNYARAGVPCLGIDPADGPAAAARQAGIPTLGCFFDRDLAARLAQEGKRADIVHANNVLAHVADTNGFVAGIGLLLAAGGVALIEVPYVRDLIEHCEFDTIYHEHLCYFSVTALDNLFRRHGLLLQRVRHLPIHGGSLRLHVGRQAASDGSPERFLAEERAIGLDRIEYFFDFGERVRRLQARLQSLLARLKGNGSRICAYGAAAKGSTLINTIGIGPDLLDYVVDRNVHKQARYMPGQRLPICPPERLLEDRPDYLLLLAWNFREEIMRQQAAFREAGGKFIVPVPEPTIL